MLQSFVHRTQSKNNSLQYLLEKNQFKIENYQVNSNGDHWLNSQQAISQKNSPKHFQTAEKCKLLKHSFQPLHGLISPFRQRLQRTQKDVLSADKVMGKFWTSPSSQVDIDSQGKENQKIQTGKQKQGIEISQLISATQMTRQSHKGSLYILSDTPDNTSQYSIQKTQVCQNCLVDGTQLKMRSSNDQELKILTTKSKLDQQIESIQQDVEMSIHQSQIQHLDDNISSVLQNLKKENSLLKIEKNIYMQQHTFIVQQMSRDMETQRRQHQDDIELLQNVIRQEKIQVSQYRGVERSVVEVEQLVSKIVMDNQSCKMKTDDNQKLANHVTSAAQDSIRRSMEIKDFLLDLKSVVEQLICLFVSLSKDSAPPLELILAQHKQRSSQIFEQLQLDGGDSWGNLHKITKKDISFKTQILTILASMNEQIRFTVQAYQQQFISEIGGFK